MSALAAVVLVVFGLFCAFVLALGLSLTGDDFEAPDFDWRDEEEST